MQRGVFAKESISNRQNARRKVNPRNRVEHRHAPLVSFRRLDVFVGALAVFPSVWDSTAYTASTHETDPLRGNTWQYLLRSFRLFRSVVGSVGSVDPVRASTFTYSRVVAYARSVLRSHTHAHAHHIPCTPVHWYCIMQPLIAVLSFTHAICCSRCNPCPVTASSVQSPSRWVSTRFIFPCDIRGDTAKSGPDSSITAKNHSLSFCYHRSYNCNNIRINERSLYPFQDLVFYVYFINKKHAFTWRYIPHACTSASVFAYSMCTPKKTHRS